MKPESIPEINQIVPEISKVHSFDRIEKINSITGASGEGERKLRSSLKKRGAVKPAEINVERLTTIVRGMTRR